MELRGPKLVFATMAVSLGTFLITLDQFIANVSIPTIAGELGVSQDNGSWIITSYTVANAVTMPLTGWMTMRVGRVKLFALSAVLFSCMSLVCGLSVTFPMLIGARVLQGLVSGALIPLSQTLLLLIFPPNKKGLAMGFWGLVVMIGPALGPVLGGWITYDYGWSWIFFINVPLGIIAGIASYALLHNQESERKKIPIDYIGIFLLLAWVAAFQVMLDRGNQDDWWRSPFIVTLTIIAVIGFVFFLLWEHFHHDPVVDLTFLKSRNFTLGSLAIGLSVFFVFGNLIVGPLWVQAQLGYTPLWAGYSLAPFGVLAIVLFPLVGIYLNVVDIRLWIAVGFVLISASFFYLSYINIHSPYANLALPRLLQGAGFALFYVPLTTLSLSGVPKERMASATGLFSFLRMLFISMGVSLSTTFWSRRENFYQSRYVSYVTPANEAWAPYVEQLNSVGIKGLHADAAIYEMVQNQAYTMSYLDLCYLSAWGFVALFLLVFLFRSEKEAQKHAKQIS